MLDTHTTGETILALEANLRASMAVHLGTF